MTSDIIAGIQPARLKALLKQMLDVYSPSGKEEEILDSVSTYLSGYGLHITRQEVDEHRSNLLVLPEDPEDVSLCFIGHLDTVSAYDLDEFGFREEGEAIYGLGSADMKSGCAAMIEAFTVLAESGHLPPQVALALVVDEEEDNSGARALSDEYNFPWAVIGEPTNLVPCLGHYGYLEVQLRTKGRIAHAAVPEHGQNAIAGMLQLLMKVTEFAASKSGELVYNIRDLSVLPLGFVVPEHCEAWLDFHLPPNSRMDVVKNELEQLIGEVSHNPPAFEAELRFEETHAGYMISPERPMVRTMKRVFEGLSLAWEPADFRSHSDANILWAAGVDPIIFGPGRLEEAHTPEECVAFAQVVDAARVYLSLALEIRGMSF